jgi:hypothetical protein
MLPFHDVETFLAHNPLPLQEIVLELRNIIASVAPDAVEVIRWGGLSYFHEGRGGIVSAGICQIGIEKDHIHLAFIHGKFLPDHTSCWSARKSTNGMSRSIPTRMPRGMN